jgi:FKBP12-rapamycin complex-associated protein
MFKSISLRHTAERTLKQTLQAITMWFRYGSNPKVLATFQDYLRTTPHKAWLNVLPQLIARLGAKDETLRASLLTFLLAISRTFPHAVIWPLITAAETPRSIHQTAAKEIMSRMREDSSISKMVSEVISSPWLKRLIVNDIFVFQAQVVGSELNRTALSFAERWKGIIEKVKISYMIALELG